MKPRLCVSETSSTMTSSTPLSVDVPRAKEIWEAYCRTHDVSELTGQTAGIEPRSGRIMFGESAIDVHDKLIAEGVDAPFYAVRVGFDYYLRKGRRR
jgi:hypothetical protein